MGEAVLEEIVTTLDEAVPKERLVKDHSRRHIGKPPERRDSSPDKPSWEPSQKEINIGDKAAWERWVKEKSSSLYRMLRGMGSSQDEADDLLQETWAKAYRGRGGYLTGSANGWLYTIARNNFLDAKRKDRNNPTEMPKFMPEPLDAYRPPKESDDLLATLKLGERLRSARVNDNFVTPLIMQLCGSTGEEIAQALGL